MLTTPGWATTAATALAVSAASLFAAVASTSAAWGSRTAGIVVAVAIAAAAREAARDDVLGWTLTVAVSAITLGVIVLPPLLGIAAASTDRPEPLSIVLFASSLVALTAATGRALRTRRSRAPHG